ncbi:MAG: hypothetical protein HN348_29250, partial [Proteobacteria bacterium]|nr:hypothetical protein [Pseudomonadota bacterium]
PPPPPADPWADVTSPVERACLEKHCLAADNKVECRARKCAQEDGVWGLVAERILWDGESQTIHIEAHVDYEQQKYGDEEVPRETPVYVGVTLVTPEGREIDLAVQTRFEDDIDAPFFLSAGQDSQIQNVILGLWDRKVEPCESERPGCKEFGFLLDGSLASWPPNIYIDGYRQRIPPAEVTLRVENGGVAPAVAGEVQAAAMVALQKELDLFESKVLVAPMKLGAVPALNTAVQCGNDGDVLVAKEVAKSIGEKLGADVSADRVAEDSSDIVIVLGGADGEKLHTCLAANCAADPESTECFAKHCK